jgi:hypothetical protein
MDITGSELYLTGSELGQGELSVMKMMNPQVL